MDGYFTVSVGDKIFLDFLEYAGTTLEDLKNVDRREELKAKCEAASNEITEEIFQFWSQNNALEVVIEIDNAKPKDPVPFNMGMVADIRIKNTNHKATLPLSERSAGFVWFFSFLAQFKQLKKTAGNGNAIILLDEPGLTLHGKAQGDLLRYIVERLLPDHQVKALWEYREAIRMQAKKAESVDNAEGRLLSLLNRLEGKPDAAQPTGQPPKPAFDRPRLLALRSDLLGFTQLTAQKRGYAFEALLRDLFNVFGLEAREPFRLRGEQIDGSFLLQGETYLVEAKWQDAQTGVADLHTFHGKLEQKAAWARGLFVSHSGFTEDGLVAFGRGKKVICMDGLDLFDTLSRELPLNHVLESKVRRAAETGLPFARARDLFPG